MNNAPYVIRYPYDNKSIPDIEWVYLTDEDEVTFYLDQARTFKSAFEAFKWQHEDTSDDEEGEVIQKGFVDLEELINL